jgi:hypothetical protein
MELISVATVPHPEIPLIINRHGKIQVRVARYIGMLRKTALPFPVLINNQHAMHLGILDHLVPLKFLDHGPLRVYYTQHEKQRDHTPA